MRHSRLKGLARSLGKGALVLLALVTYAYGFRVTHVDLAETRSLIRQERLVRILQILARPDIVAYDQVETSVEAPILVPCPQGALDFAQPDTSAAYLVLNPQCADSGADIQIEGFNLQPHIRGTIFLIPPSEVTLRMTEFQTDGSGHFLLTAQLPERPNEEVQHIRASSYRNVGSPHLTQTARDTWDKIIETVFMALLATTLGTAIAMPLSFLAARNLMKDITSPVGGIALAVIAVPVGVAIGAGVSRWAGALATALGTSLWVNLVGFAVGASLTFLAMRWALPQEELTPPGRVLRTVRPLVLVATAFVGIISLYLLGTVATSIGTGLAALLGPVDFLGSFVADLGSILSLIISLMCALAGAGLMAGVAGRLGKLIDQRLPQPLARPVDLLLAAAAGACLVGLIGAGIGWLYVIGDPVKTIAIPALAGAAMGLALALRLGHGGPLPVGLVIYYVSRTIFNALRSIEALIMVIVFAVWVGIGPFAGVLALSLHSIAALAKLYSEQVESILPGPIEAITATGANRLQTIIYGVVPQIIPPFISFTMYRWDINVRMSTIIGFAGGGGIGFLLQQNINLLNYRAASAQMLAIAIVVATMDYISSQLRERVV